MSVFGSNEELIDKIKKQVVQIKSDGLNPAEFEKLLSDTRELYERVLILRYKAFENHVGKSVMEGDVEETETVVENSQPLAEIEDQVNVETPETSEVKKEEEPFAFSLFGEIEEEGSEEVVPSSQTTEVIQPEAQKEKIQPEVIVSNQPIIEHESTSLLEKLSEQNNANRLSDKLKLSKITSLSSTFTLNDRIRFSQGLFNGNNDAFQQAVHSLDASENREQAMDLLKKYGAEYAWEMDSKDVEHFYEFVERLHV
jgi:hypothetical protein